MIGSGEASYSAQILPVQRNTTPPPRNRGNVSSCQHQQLPKQIGIMIFGQGFAPTVFTRNNENHTSFSSPLKIYCRWIGNQRNIFFDKIQNWVLIISFILIIREAQCNLSNVLSLILSQLPAETTIIHRIHIVGSASLLILPTAGYTVPRRALDCTLTITRQ